MDFRICKVFDKVSYIISIVQVLVAKYLILPILEVRLPLLNRFTFILVKLLINQKLPNSIESYYQILLVKGIISDFISFQYLGMMTGLRL